MKRKLAFLLLLPTLLLSSCDFLDIFNANSDEKTVNKWFSTPMWRLIIEGDCMVLNECGIFLPDGSATMYFDYMLTNNDYSKAKETVAALKKYLGTMSNLFREC